MDSQMNVIDSKTQAELLQSLLAEEAKSSAEIRCAQADIAKAQNRLQFIIAVINNLIDR
jgi:hypothetical protein